MCVSVYNSAFPTIFNKTETSNIDTAAPRGWNVTPVICHHFQIGQYFDDNILMTCLRIPI